MNIEEKWLFDDDNSNEQTKIKKIKIESQCLKRPKQNKNTSKKTNEKKTIKWGIKKKKKFINKEKKG